MGQNLKILIGNQTQIPINQLTVIQMVRMGMLVPTLLHWSARERKLSAKYDGFIIGPLKQYNNVEHLFDIAILHI